MIIKYQKTLQDNLSVPSKRSNFIKTSEGLSLEKIETLEAIYNSGNPFPKSLRELLYLAGKKCYVLAYHINGLQDIMQQKVRAKLNRYRETISRPFYAIDVYVPE